jgi:DNA-binding CsgD family transcriptional regulator
MTTTAGAARGWLSGGAVSLYFRRMSRSAQLSGRDVDGVLSVLGLAASTNGAQPFELPVLERLVKLIPADGAGYWEYGDGRDKRETFFVELDPCGTKEWAHWLEAIANGLQRWWPLRDDRLRPLGTATFFSDLVGVRDKLNHPWYAEVMRPSSQEHECKVLLPTPAGITRGFYFYRNRGFRDFDERDRAVLNALRPHLEGVRRRWERRRVRADGLTARERELIVLLRDGLTNQEIAERLVISTGTVRTHLENIFGKLGVHTRTAAVARALGANQEDDAG